MLPGLITLLLFALTLRAAEPPRRIVSTAPSITEMLYALDLGDRVVGVTTFCHYPPEVRQKPKIGSYTHPNLEAILEMHPDLVVVLKEHGNLREQLRNVGLPLLELQHNTLDGIYQSLSAIGKRAAVEDRAEQRIAQIQQALAEVRSRVSGLPKRSVMFIVGRTPDTIRDLIVVGHSSFLNELITMAGGRNLFEESLSYYPKIPREEIYARRPEVIIDMGDMSDTDQVTEEHKRSVVALWAKLPMLPAVKEGRVYSVAEDIFVVPGPRVVEAARALLRMIHPEVAP